MYRPLSAAMPGPAVSVTLETTGYGAKTFFVRDVQPLVLQACRRHGVPFEDFATRLGITRVALVLMLKGQDPVPRHLLDSIREFVDSAPAANSDSGPRAGTAMRPSARTVA